MGFTAAGILSTTVTNESTAGADDASQLAPLGFQLTVPDGNQGLQTWVYVKASGALGEGDICQLIDAAVTYEVVQHPAGLSVNDVAMRVMGVAQHAIGDNGFGFILAKGFGNIMSGSGGIVANIAVTPNGAGGDTGRGLAFVAATTTDACIIAHCTVAGGANALAGCYINCPGA
jgi:hypothetical protein